MAIRYSTNGTFSGRFFTSGSIPARQQLVDVAVRLQLPEHPPDPVPRLRIGTSAGAEPRSGIVEDETAGSYRLEHGICRAWVVEEERSVPNSALRLELRRAAMRTHQIPFERLHRGAQEDLKERARADLRRRALPRHRFIDVILADRSPVVGFIGTRHPDNHPGLMGILRQLFGSDLQLTPLAWRWSDSTGWHARSLQALQGLIEQGPEGEGRLSDEVVLTAVRLSGKDCRFQGSGPDGQFLALYEQLLNHRSGVDIEQMSFSVRVGRETVDLDVDEQGLFSAHPPHSAGGLEGDRIRRRFDDLLAAADLLALTWGAPFAEGP